MTQQRASSCVPESSLTARLCFCTITVWSLNSPPRKIGPQFIYPKIVPKRKGIWSLWGLLTCLRWVDKNLRGKFGFGNPRILQGQRFYRHPAKRYFNMCFFSLGLHICSGHAVLVSLPSHPLFQSCSLGSAEAYEGGHSIQSLLFFHEVSHGPGQDWLRNCPFPWAWCWQPPSAACDTISGPSPPLFSIIMETVERMAVGFPHRWALRSHRTEFNMWFNPSHQSHFSIAQFWITHDLLMEQQQQYPKSSYFKASTPGWLLGAVHQESLLFLKSA